MKQKKQNPGLAPRASRDQLGGWSHRPFTATDWQAQTLACQFCLAARLEMDRWSIQPRTSELRRKGLIRDSGRRRPNATGKRAIVWIASDLANGSKVPD